MLVSSRTHAPSTSATEQASPVVSMARIVTVLNPEAAYRKLIAAITPIDGGETVDTARALGRFAAEDIVAPVDLPPFDASAMDGYAVAARDLEAEAPFEMRVIGASHAGRPGTDRVGGRDAVRILTGAVLPPGADAIVLQEDTERRGDTLTVTERPRPGQHVRTQGHDIARGATVVAAGSRLDAYRLSWLTACGIGRVAVKPRVRVAVFATGDELVDVGETLGPGQIYESNRFALIRLMADLPVEVVDLGRLPDDPEATRAALVQAADDTHLVVTSGGVSVGDADYVRDAVLEVGHLDFWKIALKPGKPLAVGRIGGADFFGLPGNPVSTIVTFLLFVVPAIVKRAGGVPKPPLRIPARLAHGVRHTPGRREYQRGVVAERDGQLVVAATGDQSSNRLATFDGANCLIEVPEDRSHMQRGDAVLILLLEQGTGRLF